MPVLVLIPILMLPRRLRLRLYTTKVHDNDNVDEPNDDTAVGSISTISSSRAKVVAKK